MVDGGVRMEAGPSTPPGRGRVRRGGRVLAAVGLALVLFVVGGIGLFRTVGKQPAQGPSTTDSRSTGSALAEQPVILSGTLQDAIASLQQRLRAAPEDWQSWANLGLAYVQEARVTADPRYYPKAQGALERSLRLQPDGNFSAYTGEGALALARHDFAGGLRWGDKARAVNAYNGNVYGVIGDAQIELGRYHRAFATIQHMVNLKPDLSSYARVSYARELQGDVPGAIQAMRMAFDAAGTPDDQAFAAYYLGELYFNSDRTDRAAAWYRRGAQLAPEYFPPQEGLARVAWADGDVQEAIRLYRGIVSRYPLPQYVIALGDQYTATGQTAEAQRQYALVRVEEKLFQANGVNVDLELALFDADHGNPRAAVAAAKTEWGRRHSVLVADALGWALHANGHDAEALRYATFATKLGYRNALLYFHRGMIEKALGDAPAARRDLQAALDINPRFSILYSPVAAQALAALGGPA
ncbi:MAG: tetratricopeptide repeat protein [Actinomycetota bacterium]|nr:tetratricopeptide repeat protein [Actinomycetota bacterium]